MSNHSKDTFDYVIVGAGAAGCLLANRLVSSGASVCLLEAGPRDLNPFFHIPAGFMKVAFDPRYTWGFKSAPSAGTAGRQISLTQGKTLGGSSSVNGFNYVRGQPDDYNAWAQASGNEGWRFDNILPYFKRSERRIGPADTRYRGTAGLLPITDCDWRHPLCDAFIEGAHSLGAPKNIDYNSETQASTGYYQRWIYRGQRVSSARAFLKPIKKNSLLTIRTGAHATKVLFEGRRAVGVTYAKKAGAEQFSVRARREVILSAGAANTPKLLQLSGVGPKKLLTELGIPVIHELAGVGENLKDHYMLRMVIRVKDVETINDVVNGPKLLREILRWLVRKPSMLGISPSVASLFWQSNNSLSMPDLQFHFTPGSYMNSTPGLLDKFPGMSLGFYQLRPASAGYVRAASTNPFEPPVIQPNYLANETDQRVAIDAIRLTRQLLQTAPLQKYYLAEEAPGKNVLSDQELLDFARENGGTAYHLMGTCRMGLASDPTSVVDDQLRVIGLECLRVVDASVMPDMPSANLQAPVMMIAEKAADMILGHRV